MAPAHIQLTIFSGSAWAVSWLNEIPYPHETTIEHIHLRLLLIVCNNIRRRPAKVYIRYLPDRDRLPDRSLDQCLASQ